MDGVMDKLIDKWMEDEPLQHEEQFRALYTQKKLLRDRNTT